MRWAVACVLFACACESASPAPSDHDANVAPDAATPLADAAVRDDAAPPVHESLTRFTPLEVGSAECPFGGRRVESGLDDGSGGGVADDGVLSDGEVDDSYVDCDTYIPDPGDAIEPPPGPAGDAVVDLRGGDALAQGGAGGSLRAESVGGNPCLAELTRIFPTGALAFAPPELEPSQAAGLHIAAGEAMTVSGNITLEGDVLIEGTLTVEGEAFGLEARALHVTSTGRIEAPHGASLQARELLVFEGALTAPGADVELASGGPAWLRGSLDASGAAGAPAGNILIRTVDAELISQAELRADGGDGESAGGDAGSIALRIAGEELGTTGVRLSIAGTLSARGGAASDALGSAGAGGRLFLSHCLPAQSVVELLGYQALELGGGAASMESGQGGAAGSFVMALDYGVGESRRLALHVPLHVAGGAGFASGAGGELSADFLGLQAVPAQRFPVLKHAWPSWIPTILLAADVDLDAGASAAGGSARAGSARVRAPGKLEVRGAIRARGGESTAAAGAGGTVALAASSELTLSGVLSVDGASGGEHAGGSGGCISLDAPTFSLTPGNVSAKGGAGQPPGSAGQVHTDGTACAVEHRVIMQ